MRALLIGMLLVAASWACVGAILVGAWVAVARAPLSGLGLLAAGIAGFVALGWWMIQD